MIVLYSWFILLIISNTSRTNCSTIAFGSCNRQNKLQSFWGNINSVNPIAFLWLGDAVYAKSSSLEDLGAAYDSLTQNNYYLNFTKDVIIDGIWDDHDFGVNDGGGHQKDKSDRRQLYKKFLSAKNQPTEVMQLTCFIPD